MKDLKNLPSMPFLVDRYMNDTRRLTLEEHGAYLLLLCEMWSNRGYIPDDDLSNSRLLGLDPQNWLRLKQRLEPLLLFGSGKISQKRLQLQWNYAQENRLRQSEKGKLGAISRAERKEVFRGISRGSSTGNARVEEKAGKTSTESEHSYKKDIPIPLSNTVGAESIQEAALPEIPEHLNRLLNTGLMKRTA